MCGINGFISFAGNIESYDIQEMNNLIVHRGPDDEGKFIEKNDYFDISMGMTRLSIIDIESGAQPIYSDGNDVVIVFNGEIYNYRELKEELEEKKINFKTNSDTEVILKLYLEYGTESFIKLDGMFAFSIYDKRLKRIFIARDFFGEKPLYYTNEKNNFIWGSELKSVISQIENKPEISKKSLNLYFSLTYIPAPYTIYERVFKLEPNKYIEYSVEKKRFLIHQIHQENKKEKFNGSFNKAKDITKKLVKESVSSRSVSDVSIGTFLSGGVDSSIVSYCLSQNEENRINTFSIGFDKRKFDETEKSRVVAKLIKSKHHEFVINEESLYSDLDEILNNFDEPFADSSALPTYLVAKITSDHVKVALTGDGGDEVFGGYNKYYINYINDRYTNLVSEKAHNFLKKTTSFLLRTKDDNRGLKFKARKTIDSIDYNDDFYWNIISLGFKGNEINRFFKDSGNGTFDYYKKNLGLNKPKSLFDLRNIDKHISLEGDMLVKVDRVSMLSSLECRSPFLNKTLWDFTNSLPEKYLIKGFDKKHILKEAFKEYFPNGFLKKSKKGFGVPVGDWLKIYLKDELLSYIEKSFILEQNIFQLENIQKLVNEHLNSITDNTFKVWTFYCFQKWYINVYERDW